MSLSSAVRYGRVPKRSRDRGSTGSGSGGSGVGSSVSHVGGNPGSNNSNNGGCGISSSGSNSSPISSVVMIHADSMIGENRVTQSSDVVSCDGSTSSGVSPTHNPYQNQREIENKQLAMYDIILTISQAHHAHCSYTEEKMRGLIRKPAIFSMDHDHHFSGSGSGSIDGSGSIGGSPGMMDNGSPPWMTPDSLETQKIIMWQNFAVLVTPSIQRVVEFAKRVPSFLELTQDDQLIMIKLGFFEVWLVHVSRMANQLENTLTFSDGTYVTKQQMELMFDVSIIWVKLTAIY